MRDFGMYGAFVYEAQNARKICHMEVVVETRCVGASASVRSTSSEACMLRAVLRYSGIPANRQEKMLPCRGAFSLNKWIACVLFNCSQGFKWEMYNACDKWQGSKTSD